MGRYIQNIPVFILLLNFTLISMATGSSFSEEENKPGTASTKEIPDNIIVYESFENGLIPEGWVQEINSTGDDGFSVYWNVREGMGKLSGSIWGFPKEAAVGNKNLVFQHMGVGHETRLISAPMNLEFIVNPELTFFHAQNRWILNTNDRVGVYYREGSGGNWVQLQQYNNEVVEWTLRTIPLPSGSSEFYIAFVGQNLHGMGVGIDEFTVTETGEVPRQVNRVETDQASYEFAVNGSRDNPILKTQIRITGNTNDLNLTKYTAHAQNTNNADIASIKLYYTQQEEFNTDNLLAQASSFSNGKVVFDNISKKLPTGYSYLWLAYDIANDITHGNLADAYIPANGITISGQHFPTEAQNPPGHRELHEALFFDNFDDDQGWTLTGEFEIDIPQGLGGSSGYPGPDYAFSGNRVLGTDLTGLGDFPGDYEPNIPAFGYQAISPEMDLYYYRDIKLTFQRWLNLEATDRAYIHVSDDGGETWHQVWSSLFQVIGVDWTAQLVNLEPLRRKKNSKFRFSIGPTDASNNFSGWNIDNVTITGTHITRDAGITQWITPTSGCGMSDSETVTVTVENFGAKDITEPVPLGFSLDGGQTWHTDTLRQTIPYQGSVTHTFAPKADFSQSGRYDNIIAAVLWEKDQDNTNDTLYHSVFSIPHIAPPYSEIFADNDGLWTAYGENSSWQWAAPAGSVFDEAAAGGKAWVTNPTGTYNTMEASWLESPCFDFTDNLHPVLEFYLNTHTAEGMDGVSLQYSLDEEDQWHTVQTLDQATTWGWFDTESPVQMLNETFNTQYGWHGNSEGWKRVRAVLTPAVAGQGKVQFRMIFASQESQEAINPFEGIAFDRVSIYESPHDIGIAAIVDPVSTCELLEEQSITVRIENYGLNALESGTEIPVGIDVNEVPSVYEYFTLQNDLLPGATIQYTFDALFDLSAETSHSITAYTLLPGDTDFYNPGFFNDTLATTIAVHGYPQPFIGDTIYSMTPTELTLDAGDQFVTYLWQDGSTEQTFNITSPYTSWYEVTITDQFNCPGTDSVLVIAYDLEVVEFVEPVDACELTAEELIGVKIRNHGPDTFAPGEKFPWVLEHEGVKIAQEDLVIAQNWQPGQDRTLQFSVPVDLTNVTTHNFRVYAKRRDANMENDTLNQSIIVHGYPDIYLPSFITTDYPEDIILAPGEGYASYLWHDGSTHDTYPVETWGVHSVEVGNYFGCIATAQTEVLPEFYDLAVHGLAEPAEACIDMGEQQVTMAIKNTGNSGILKDTELLLSYTLEDQDPVEESFVLETSMGPGNIQEFTFSQPITLPQAGTYNILLTLSFEGDQEEDNNAYEAQIKVYPLPEPYLGEDVYTTEPHNLILSPGNDFVSYVWHDGSTEATFQVTNMHSALYSVTVTDQNGCSNTDSLRVITYNLEMDSIITPLSHCSLGTQEPVKVKVLNLGYDDFETGSAIQLGFQLDSKAEHLEEFIMEDTWEKNTARYFTFHTKVDMSVPANYTLRAFVATPNAKAETDDLINHVDVSGKPYVNLGPDIYTSKLDTVILNAGAGYAEYSWHDGQNSQYYYPDEFGWKWVLVKDIYGCIASDTLFVGFYTSTENPLENALSKVYPNPARNQFTVELDDQWMQGEVVMELMDARGTIVRSAVIMAHGVNRERINISGLRAGVYFLHLTREGFRKTHRITILE